MKNFRLKLNGLKKFRSKGSSLISDTKFEVKNIFRVLYLVQNFLGYGLDKIFYPTSSWIFKINKLGTTFVEILKKNNYLQSLRRAGIKLDFRYKFLIEIRVLKLGELGYWGRIYHFDVITLNNFVNYSPSCRAGKTILVKKIIAA